MVVRSDAAQTGDRMKAGLVAALPLSGVVAGMMDISNAHRLCSAWETVIAAAQQPAAASA